MKFHFLTLFVTFSLCLSAWAGGVDVSGGGHGVDDGTEVLLLDLVEKGIAKKAPPQNQFSKPIEKAIQNDLTTLSELDVQQEALLGLLHELFEVSDLLGIAVLKTIHLYNWVQVDHPLELVPVNTVLKSERLVQVAVRKSRMIHIDRNLWKKMNSSHQAALIVHEALHALSHTCPESRARQILGALYSGELKQMDPVTREDFITSCLPHQWSAKQSLFEYFFVTNKKSHDKIDGLGLLYGELKNRNWKPIRREWRIHPETQKLNVVFFPHQQVWNSYLETLVRVKSITTESDRSWAENLCKASEASDQEPKAKARELLTNNVFFLDLFFEPGQLNPVVHWQPALSILSYSRFQTPTPANPSCWAPLQKAEENWGPVILIKD